MTGDEVAIFKDGVAVVDCDGVSGMGRGRVDTLVEVTVEDVGRIHVDRAVYSVGLVVGVEDAGVVPGVEDMDAGVGDVAGGMTNGSPEHFLKNYVFFMFEKKRSFL